MNTRQRRGLDLTWPVVAGIALMAIGGTGFVIPFYIPIMPNAVTPFSSTSLAVILGSFAVFVLGWLLVGAGLRPRGSARRGVFLSLAVYLAVGLAWTVLYGFLFGFAFEQMGAASGAFTLAMTALLWPLFVPFILGWFGLGPR